MGHKEILESQLSSNPLRITVDEAIEIYQNASLNDLMYVASMMVICKPIEKSCNVNISNLI